MQVNYVVRFFRWSLCLMAIVFTIFHSSVSVGDDKQNSTEPDTDNDALYYVAVKAFSKLEPRIELQAIIGADITNPFLNVFGPRLGLYYNFNPFLSAGIEGSYYFSADRDSARNLEATLERHGYSLDDSSPEYGLMGVLRVSPLTGLLNLFSSTVVQTQISLLARGGTVSYAHGVGMGPSLGTGLEIGTHFQSGFGLLASLIWDWDHPTEDAWLSRTGFDLGLSVRF
jgi:hypothetical protein